ncbi:universal stress protein [Photobacterium sp. SDRW27]|uniref:universal stress protein n=1 Tax=Photobacterium obscurum TaxID=2829490 RepID=UPI0022432728|nr:universal stress protein [Photobacterium obscurum]MCW8331010.1 universal stress protein [Photobacterium obscurum]
MKYKHVMLAVNFDGNAEYLVMKAAEQARINHALFSVIHIDPDFTQQYEGVREFRTESDGEQEHYESVDAMKRLLKGTNYPVYKHIFYAGYIEDQVAKAIAEFDIDLLIIGHHQSNIFHQLTLSPSEPLIRKMPCDIQLVRLER